MKEMDLDELDQAVSKLMDQAQSKPKKAADDGAVAVTVSSTPAAAAPKADNDGIVPVRRANLQVTPRKNGIAMDIVQAKPAQVDPPSVKAARVAPTLHPTGPVVAEDEPATPAPEPPKEDPKEETKTEVSDDTLASLDMHGDGDNPHKSVFPDPLDVHGFKDDPKKPEEAIVNTEEEKSVEPEKGATMQHEMVVAPLAGEDDKKADEPEAAKPDEDKPEDKPEEKPAAETNSPFVDAKVEKRPLGAFSESKPAEAETETKPETKSDEKPLEDESNQPHSEPASIAVQTPKELSPEVVAVESAEPEFTPGVHENDEEKGEETSMDNLRQMAIPQQYQEHDKKPSKGDRPIYDTKEYHPAIKPVPGVSHSGSRAGTVVTIILIVLMVAAAAVAYFVITGGIDITRLL